MQHADPMIEPCQSSEHTACRSDAGDGWAVAASVRGRGSLDAVPVARDGRHRIAVTATRGRIRVAGYASSNADTLDPARGSISTDYVRHYMFYSGLTQYNSRLKAMPALAEGFDTSDFKTWRFRLRKGVRFHDGSPFTAADVVYSLLRHKDPKTASGAIAIASQFDDVRADGRNDVIIRLVAPNMDLPVILCASHFLIIRNGTRDFHTANGTGPFRCKVFEPGVRSISVRNPDYWKHGYPFVDEIEFISIPDEPSRVNALLSGDVQLAGAISAYSFRRIEASGRCAVLRTGSGRFTDLIMQQDSPITGNREFNLAMKYLFDRDLMNRALFRNTAVLANDHPIPPHNPYFRKDLPQRTYDLDRARYHFRRSGLGGVRLPMYASSVADGSIDMATVVQEYAQRAGITLSVNRIPADGYWSSHWKKHPLTFGNINPRPTADIIFTSFMKSDSRQNESHWKNPRFDQMLLAARTTQDEARRRLLYGDMQEMVRNECGLVIPLFLSLMDGYDKRLGGLGYIPIGEMMGFSFAEYVWWKG